MNIEQIEKLVKLIEDSALTEFSYKDEEIKVTMSKLDHPPVISQGVTPVGTPERGAQEEESAKEEEARYSDPARLLLHFQC